jgi:membrane protease YdiL (CAAX protease family)
VIGMSVFLGWVRRASGSVWPCALLHASHNLFFLHLFDPVVPLDAAAAWLVGEQGALLAGTQLLLGGVAVWATRGAARGTARRA